MRNFLIEECISTSERFFTDLLDLMIVLLLKSLSVARYDL